MVLVKLRAEPSVAFVCDGVRSIATELNLIEWLIEFLAVETTWFVILVLSTCCCVSLNILLVGGIICLNLYRQPIVVANWVAKCFFFIAASGLSSKRRMYVSCWVLWNICGGCADQGGSSMKKYRGV
jgi:uncharacterized membrane protein